MAGIYGTASYKVIYIFSIPDDAHTGMVKVGDATIKTTLTLDELKPNSQPLRDAADKGRIKDYTFTAGIKVDLLWAELAIIKKEDVLDGYKVTTIQGFRDHNVHDVLKNSGISVSYPNGIKNKEWFECDWQTAKNAITAVKEGKSFLSEADKAQTLPTPKIVLRDEQDAAVQKTHAIFANNDKMLWNCKMRFGKTLTAYELIRSGKYQKTIVVTHRPVVEEGWEKDHGKLFGKDSNHVFMKKQNLSYSVDYYDYSSDFKNDAALRNAKARGDYFTYFASMQDLRGSTRAGGKYNKNNAVFDMDWDLIIYDEAHEGTKTDLGQTVRGLLEKAKNGKKPKILDMSGTPYNILGDFSDNVYTWDYVMEQRTKEEWDMKHPGERNPYADMPKMHIFTFDMSEALETSYRFVTESSAFNFREFFRTWTGEAEKDFRPIPAGRNVGDFVHGEDVWSFLNLISSENDSTNYPFATPENRQEFKHTFWMVPGVKEAKALSAMLRSHPIFGNYHCVNVAGDGDEEIEYDNALKNVQEAIKKYDYTITISCGRLTTGVTVPEWTAVMMLAGSAKTEAKGYMQTIFRVQSAGQIDGKQKEDCYVFDFAPDRTLQVLSDVHKLSSKGASTDAQHKQVLAEFINYCPVIAINGTKMEPYNVNSLMRQIKHINIEAALKSGFEDDSIYKVDAGMVLDEKDREFFDALNARLTAHNKSKAKKEVTVAKSLLGEEEYKQAKKLEHKPKKELTPEQLELLEKLKEQKQQQKKLFGLLRNISIRLPLLIYGADVPLTEALPLSKFTEIVDGESWKEFMPEDVSKDLFMRSIKYFDEDVLMEAGFRLRKLAKQADEYPPTERIKRITEIIGHFRNPDKETVLTPWRVVNMHLSDTIGGYCFFDESFDIEKPLETPRFVNRGDVTGELFYDRKAQLLEINSKSGLYPLYLAYSCYSSRLSKKEEDYTFEEQQRIWNQVLKENIYVLCKTTMAEKITIRTLAGFTEEKVHTYYRPHLIERMKDDMNWVVKKVKNPANWGKEGEQMKFKAIVGNPPYQVMDGGNAASSVPIYNYFVINANKIEPQYSTMIMPARWYAGGKGLNEFREAMLSDTHIKKLFDFPNSEDCFQGVNIAGGLCYYLWDKSHSGNCSVFNNRLYTKNNVLERPLNEFPIFVRSNIAVEIIRRIDKSKSFKDIVKSYSYFAVRSYERGAETRNNSDDVILLSSNGKGYYPIKKVLDKENILDKYKVIITYAMSGGNKPSSSGDYQVVSSLQVLEPNEICTETYLVLDVFENKQQAQNMCNYVCTKFFRFLLLQALTSIHITKESFIFVPEQSFNFNSDIDWSTPIPEIDQQLYAKYNLTEEEISFIESMIKPME